MWDFVLEIFRGDDILLEFTLRDTRTGEPFNLSGYTLYFAAADKNGNLIINKQMSIVDPTSGKASTTLTKQETAKSGRYIAEIEGRLQTGEVTTFAQGLLIIREDIRK